LTVAAGVRLGPYEITGPLGAGGMGEVHRARDARLGRDVAIKILPAEVASDPERRARFEREARAASALNHPNIVTIYDVGSGTDGALYIAMERVDGSTLRHIVERGPLPAAALLDVGAQIAGGLARAHAAGITHRDLKPENVMVNTDGLVKILDFGLAKRIAVLSADSRSPTATRGDTEEGALLGTVGYMSPEQASGRPADFRSDQFSLGAILYELASGRRAFQRPTAAETLAAIIRDEPPPLAADIPPALQRLIARCLEKDPAGRYASTEDLARDLQGLRDSRPEPRPSVTRRRALWAAAVLMAVIAAAAGGWTLRRGRASAVPVVQRSIAVLPFQGFGGRAEDDYFLDGMTESVITDLAKSKDLLVIARNSVFQYKGKPVDVRQVGKDLGVRYVLEGSIQRAGDRLRLNAQLIDVASGYHLWAERYDRQASDIFAVQDDISQNVVTALKVALAPAAKASPPTSSLEAYDAYLHGLYLSGRGVFERKSVELAVESFARAVALDPNFALAHAALANQYRQIFFQYDAAKEWEEKAYVALQKALALDPELPEAYVTRGMLTWTLANGFPHEPAIEDFRRALAGNPNLVQAHGQLCAVYGHIGLLEEAEGECEAARRINPTGLGAGGSDAQRLLFQHRYEDVLRVHERSPQLGPRAVALSWAPALIALGRDREAREVVEEGLRKEPSEPNLHAVRALLLARAGDHAEAEEMIRRAAELGKGLGHFHHTEYFIACAYAALNRKAEAITWFERAIRDGFPCYPYFEKDALLAPIRREPAFQEAMNKLKVRWEHYKTLV
jgi:non-specific serine/threonine protein kinase